MLKMKINRADYNNDNTPILYDREIDEYAHAVLKDYKPQLLREPGTIRAEHFLESYLGVELIFRDIYNEDPEHPIFGAFTFAGGTLKIFDKEKARAMHMIVRPNTVVIDNAVKDAGKEGLAMFTGLHEAGHILIHHEVYASRYNKCYELNRISPIAYCQRDSAENVKCNRKLKSPKQWREHQADYFAAAVAMPNATFKPLVNEYMREHGIWKCRITLGTDDDLDILASDLLPERITEVYGVSKTAALIKLKKNGFIVK